MIRFFLVLLLSVVAFPSWAEREITNVVLSPSTASPQSSVNVSITVRTSGNNQRWRSTLYWLNGRYTCVNTGDYYSRGTYTESFNITAPNSTRNYNVYFYAYPDQSCNNENRVSDEVVKRLVVRNNQPPTNITLSNNSAYEFQAYANSTIGTLSAVDASSSDTHTFGLLTSNSGTTSGSCNAGVGQYSRFNITGNTLKVGSSGLSEGSYTLCVSVNDSEGNSYRRNLTVNVNSLPNNANFFNINEDEIVRHKTYNGSEVGAFSGADLGSGINFTYALINYDGNTDTGSCSQGLSDNEHFSITGGNKLVVSSTALLNVRDYTICARATTPQGYSIRKNFTISVTETPTSANFFDINNDTVAANNASIGDTIGQFFAASDGSGLNLTYAMNFASNNRVGTCASTTDNYRFEIVGTSLRIINTHSADNLPAGTYDICISATDQNNVIYVEDFTITVSPPVASCPNTSGHNTIYTDNFSSNSDNWSAVNFNRSVSAWPGDNVVQDNDEDQDVDFSISSGQMRIEGSAGANSDGNNEYGAVLHDLTAQRYTPSSITDYSIEVDMAANATNINNDVGVIFGYQDDRNYYLIRWTKIGTVFQNNSRGYPGIHRNLDLIKVSNGTASTLSSIANQDLANPSTIKVTVNSDGITICVEGAVKLTAAGEQPPIYKYGFFTYENEDGVNFDNLVVQCNGCQTLQCPNTSAYNLIYEDNFGSDSGNWLVNNFNRSVSVWPGESIENDSTEDQNVNYVVSNGRMNIEGSAGANSGGNNEYGAVLHDLTTERYEPENINEYSIDVDMYAPLNSSGYLNNDVGVIFGYQNDNNYYVIKWTKYGDRFANEQDYPGKHKNLDLIKVSNGVATTLDSIEDYDAPYPSRIKITVNANGIVICFDGTAVLSSANERPNLHKYGFFTYENEEGVSFDNLEVRCNGCMQTLQCPNTSSYSLIFEDKFNTTPNNNWQAHTLDRNNVDVWPNDTIHSNNEERSIMFEVRNGLMDIAGTVSTRPDNEFGVVIHDVNAEGYDDSQITTYSINTKFTSHSGEANNNDAGVVFGYQNESNFYVLKWTKFAQNYASNTTFPGTYRNLEVIKVANGQPTRLGVEPNFYADDDIDLKITVDANGITICVNGDNLIQIANERPSLGEVGFFSYDNDYGVSFDDFQVWCQGCTASTNVDHYRILHPTAGLTCSTYDITVAACENASCSSYSTETVTGSLRKTYGSSTDTILAVNTTTGTQTTKFGHNASGIITFGLNNFSPEADNNLVCVTGTMTGATTNCQMTFADSGFEITTLDDFVSASGWQLVNIRALKSNPASLGSCAPAFQGPKSVGIDFDYVTPTIGDFNDFDQEQLSFTANNSQAGQSFKHNEAITTNLTFDAQAESKFYINYADVGNLRLTVSDTNNVLEPGIKTFNVYPKNLVINLNDGANDLGIVGNENHFASQPFNLKITAVNHLGNVTNNYRPGDLEMLPYMTKPVIGPGDNDAKATSMSYIDSLSINKTLTVTNGTTSSDWQDADLLFNTTGYNKEASFNNVGTFKLDVRDTNYLGYSIQAAEVNAGKFVPFYFVVSEHTEGAIRASGTGYSYIGETLPYATNPVIKMVPKDFKGNTAKNYGGSGDANGTFNFTTNLSDRSYAEKTSNTGFNGGNKAAGSVSYSEHENYTGEFLITLSGDTFTYAKSITPRAKFTSGIELTFTADDLKDGDGIGYCSEPLDIPGDSCPTTYKPFTIDLAASPELRYGRLRLNNTSTNVTETDGKVYIPFVVEYWDAANGRFVTNTDDSSTRFDTLTGDITKIPSDPPETISDFLDNSGSNVVNGLPLNGQGIYLPVRDSSDDLLEGEYLLQLNNLPLWLNVDWDGDGDIDANDHASSSVIFSSFSGNNRIIYKRER